MKTTWLILLVLILALVSAIPKKGGGGFSHSHSKPDFSGANKVFKATSTVKAKNFKNVKKVALVAAGAYAGYQLAKLGTKFGSWSHGGSWGFDDWDDWREADGMLCRTSDDCRWVDRRFTWYHIIFQISAFQMQSLGLLFGVAILLLRRSQSQLFLSLSRNLSYYCIT